MIPITSWYPIFGKYIQSPKYSGIRTITLYKDVTVSFKDLYSKYIKFDICKDSVAVCVSHTTCLPYMEVFFDMPSIP